ncbi:MAG: DNA polymerase III subunit gamma/tau [Pedosphaera sp.]|nr:DNA polymerase III subunit gamma/tau [Pedosphaera sp.]
MSYQVIARKYRPQRFSDVVGQEHVTQTLANAILQKRIAHAYLFVGPRGTGKTTLARIFAKCLRCEKGPTPEPCDECSECRAITVGNSMDMLEFDAASNTQVEKIRDIIIDHVKYAPSSGSVKLYLVDEVHMLSNSSFNALLKTLEEPPAHVKFLFATTDPEKVPATILSRCQRFDLRRIPSKLIVTHLAYIAKAEGVRIDEAALHAIARGAEGGMRDAESTLDQLISFCGEQIVENDVLSMFGLAARGQILSLVRAILDGDVSATLQDLNELAKNGKDLGRLLGDLLSHCRNLLLYVVSKGDLSLVEVSEAEATALAEQSPLTSLEAMTRILDVFTECERRLREAASKKILIEVALLKAIEARHAVSLDVVLRKLQSLKEGRVATAVGGDAGASAQAAAHVPPPSVVAAPRPARASAPPVPEAPALRESPPPAAKAPDVPAAAPVPSAPPSPAGDVPRDLETLWTSIIEAVAKVSPFAKSYLIEAHPVSLAKNVFTIGFDPEFAEHLGLVDNSKTRTLLHTKLKELGCGDVQVKFIKAEAPAGRVRPVMPEPARANQSSTLASAPSVTRPAGATAEEPKKEKPQPIQLNKEDFKNDPLIKQALEIFKGTIVEVRA